MEKNQADEERVEALRLYGILDTQRDSDFDGLTSLAARFLDVPISLVSLLDLNRQWFKSHHGLEVRETPIEQSFCYHAIKKPESIFVIEDARTDQRFKDNPLVTGEPNIVFYAGVPLVDEDKVPLGTFCIIDRKPRTLNDQEKEVLQILANQVVKLMTLRKREEELLKEVEKSRRYLKEVHHRVKNDIQLIMGLMQMSRTGDQKLDEIMDTLSNRVVTVSKVHQQLCEAPSDGSMELGEYIRELMSSIIKGLYPPGKELKLAYSSEDIWLPAEECLTIGMIINELITNTLKYAFPSKAKDEIYCRFFKLDSHQIRCEFGDNGVGELSRKMDTQSSARHGVGIQLLDSFVKQLKGTFVQLDKEGEGFHYQLDLHVSSGDS